jgi:hypothetical protein
MVFRLDLEFCGLPNKSRSTFCAISAFIKFRFYSEITYLAECRVLNAECLLNRLDGK